MSLIQRDGAYKVHLANFSCQVGRGVGEGRLHFEKKERLTRLEMEKESQYGAGESAAGWHRGGTVDERKTTVAPRAVSGVAVRERRQSGDSKRETKDASEPVRLMAQVFESILLE